MSVTALVCPKCGAPVRVTAAGRSISVVCGNCASTLDAATPELRLLAEGAAALSVPEIPLGTRGTLAGVEWEAIGYLERSADGDGWREYLLFNPWEGYAWLVDSGSFAFGAAILAEPETIERTARIGNQLWQGKRRYDAQVDLALGEFYWRVAVGETVAVAEYMLGSETLSMERGSEGVSWTLLTPQDPGVVETAFGIAPRMPADPPVPGLTSLWPQMLVVATIAFLALTLVDAVFQSSDPVEVAQLEVPINGTVVSQSAGPIDLPRGRNYVVIRAVPVEGQLDNEWLDLDYTLVNRRSQASYPVSAVAERYRGVDADGPWTEGVERPQVSMAAVPGGRYDLIVEATGQRWQSQYRPDTDQPDRKRLVVMLETGGTDASFYWLAALLLFLWPIILLIMNGDKPEQEDEW